MNTTDDDDDDRDGHRSEVLAEDRRYLACKGKAWRERRQAELLLPHVEQLHSVTTETRLTGAPHARPFHMGDS